jgi:hypothetical protein
MRSDLPQSLLNYDLKDDLLNSEKLHLFDKATFIHLVRFGWVALPAQLHYMVVHKFLHETWKGSYRKRDISRQYLVDSVDLWLISGPVGSIHHKLQSIHPSSRWSRANWRT